MDWKSILATVASNTEEHFDTLKFRFKQRFNLLAPLQILPYRGYGTQTRLFLKGRVLENRGVTGLEDNASTWDNLLNMYRRFESDEIPEARLAARFRGREQQTTTNQEGFFEFRFELAEPLEAQKIWHKIELELLDPKPSGQQKIKSVGSVLVPSPKARFGIISDIDDTIIKTSAANLLKMARITFLGNARTRLPFKGVAAFYRELQRGKNSSTYNPIFYVSSSPWNLYDLLVDFLKLQHIPLGPLLLRDYGLTATEILPLDHKEHKLTQIQTILEAYPQLPFLLIGDSGQEDAEIYHQIVQDNPGRIGAIYIRDVTAPEGDRHVQAIIEETRAAGVDMLLAADTFAAAKHAAHHGYIPTSALSSILADKAKADREPNVTERLLNR